MTGGAKRDGVDGGRSGQALTGSHRTVHMGGSYWGAYPGYDVPI